MKTQLSFLSNFHLKLIHLSPWQLRFILILLILNSISTYVLAQIKVWDKTLGGSKEDYLTNTIATADGGFLLGGTSFSGTSGDKTAANKGVSDYWIIKLNADGTKAWDRTYGGSKNENLLSLQQTSDGGYILGGNSNSGKGKDKSEDNRGGCDETGNCTADFWVVKIDAEGHKEWDKTLGGSDQDGLYALKQSQDGGYILGGYSYSGITGDKTEPNIGGNDYWVVKLRPDGTKAWDKTFGGDGEDQLSSLQQTSDGGYILGGTSQSEISGDKSEAKRGYWVVKLNPDGTKFWDKTFGGDGWDNLTSLQQTNDGGFILGGTSGSGISSDKTEASKGGLDYWIVKLNDDGKKEWDKTIGGKLDDFLSVVKQTHDGSYILGGSSYSGISGDKSEANKGDCTNDCRPDYWVVKLNADGTKAWDKTFGGTSWDFFQALALSQDGSYILGGYSISGKSGDKSEAKRGGNDWWVLKINEEGKRSQTIIFDPILYKSFGDAPFSLSASASSGLPVSYSIESGPATVQGNIITLTGVGKVTVKASQPGNATYLAAQEVFRTFLVEKPIPVTKLWDKTFAGNLGFLPNLVVATPDGGYLLGGTAYLNTSGADYSIIKTNNQGTEEWARTFGGSQDDMLRAIVATPDGGFLLGGSSESGIGGDKTEPKKGQYTDYWVIKIDGNGNKSWDKTFGSNHEDLLSDLLPTTAGGYLLGGTSYKDGHNYFVVKIDSSGNPLWEKNFAGQEFSSGYLEALEATTEGGYLLAGYSDSGIGGDKSEANRGCSNNDECPSDYWVIKIDADGNKLWDKTLGGSEYEVLSSVMATKDGGYLLAGNSQSGISGDKSQPSNGGSDYWIVKINAAGDKLWDKAFGGSQNDMLRTMISTPDGGYLLGGISFSGIGGDKSQVSRDTEQANINRGDYWLVKVEESSRKTWDKTLGGNRKDELKALITTAEGEYLVAGSSNSGISGDKSEVGEGLWIVKLKEEQQKPVPVLATFSPIRGLPGRLISIRGSGFSSATSVLFGDKPAGFQVISDQLIKAIVPVDAIRSRITVVTAGGQDKSGKSFIVLQPSIRGIAPQEGPAGTTVILVGDHFTSTKEVYFNGVKAESFKVYYKFLMTVVVPEGAISGKISLLLEGGGKATSKEDFIVIETAPAIAVNQELLRKATEQERVGETKKVVAYPNPFSSGVTLSFTLEQAQQVNLSIYSANGQQIRQVKAGELRAGNQQVLWDGKDNQGRPVAAGLYFYQLQINHKLTTGKLLKADSSYR